MRGLIFVLLIMPLAAWAQQEPDIEELKKQVLNVQQNIDQVQLNLGLTEKKFKRGILVSTIGYSLVITGGLMLGRQNDKTGQTLLVVGGATGVIGTALLIDSFKYLGRASKKKR